MEPHAQLKRLALTASNRHLSPTKYCKKNGSASSKFCLDCPWSPASILDPLSLRLSAVFLILLFCTSAQNVATIVLSGDQGNQSGWRRIPTTGDAVTSAFVESPEAPQAWYSMRMNKSPRILRLTATPDSRHKEGRQWYRILVNFKPSILKLGPDSKTGVPQS